MSAIQRKGILLVIPADHYCTNFNTIQLMVPRRSKDRAIQNKIQELVVVGINQCQNMHHVMPTCSVELAIPILWHIACVCHKFYWGKTSLVPSTPLHREN